MNNHHFCNFRLSNNITLTFEYLCTLFMIAVMISGGNKHCNYVSHVKLFQNFYTHRQFEPFYLHFIDVLWSKC